MSKLYFLKIIKTIIIIINAMSVLANAQICNFSVHIYDKKLQISAYSKLSLNSFNLYLNSFIDI